MQTSQCMSYRSLQERREGLEAFQTARSRGRRRRMGRRRRRMLIMRRMEGKRRDEEDIQDTMVMQEGMIVKFPLVPVATFAAPASRFFPARRS